MTVDGTAEALPGNIMIQCRNRWGDTWEEVEAEFDFPVPLGNAGYVKTNEIVDQPFPFKVIFFASVLDHLNRTDEKSIGSVIRSSLYEIITISRKFDLKILAAPLLKAGWRMPPSGAFNAMLTVVEEFPDYEAKLEIYSVLQEHHDYLTSLAKSYGLYNKNADSLTS